MCVCAPVPEDCTRCVCGLAAGLNCRRSEWAPSHCAPVQKGSAPYQEFFRTNFTHSREVANATIVLLTSIILSVHMEQLGFHRTDFYEI